MKEAVIKLFNKILLPLLFVIHCSYSAEIEIVEITKESTTTNIQLQQEELFIIGNKTFKSSDLLALTQKEREIFLQAARPNRLHSCLTGTNNQLFCDSKFSLCCVKANDISGLKKLPRSITSNLEVNVTDHCICSMYTDAFLPGGSLAIFVKYVAEGCTAELCCAFSCLFTFFTSVFCGAQCVKQRCCSKRYSVDRDVFL